MSSDFKIIECPRDAMQGITEFIPTQSKIDLLKSLLKCNFHTIDCGSFVSPKHIPQLADTPEVLNSLTLEELGDTKLLTIAANERGAVRSAAFPIVHYLGYPFSLSETFQRKNTNASRSDAFITLSKIKDIADASNKDVVAYISMAFGNPYGEEYKPQDVIDWAVKIAALGINVISLADTTGHASNKDIRFLFQTLIKLLPHVEFGAHFHAEPANWLDKIETATQAGCKRFDGAFWGIGGCPMSGSELVGNIATENLILYLGQDHNLALDTAAVESAKKLAADTYEKYK